MTPFLRSLYKRNKTLTPIYYTLPIFEMIQRKFPQNKKEIDKKAKVLKIYRRYIKCKQEMQQFIQIVASLVLL